MSLSLYFKTSGSELDRWADHRAWLEGRVAGQRLAFDQDTDLCREAVLDYMAGPAAAQFFNASADDASDLLETLSEVSLSFAFLATAHLSTVPRLLAHPDWLTLVQEHAPDGLTRAAAASLFVSATGSGHYRRKNWASAAVEERADGYRIRTVYPWVTGTHLARQGLVQFPVGDRHLALAFIPWRQATIAITPQASPLAVLQSSASTKMMLTDTLVQKDQVLCVREFPPDLAIGQAQVLPYVFGIGRALLLWAEEAAALRGQEVTNTLLALAYELEELSRCRRTLPPAADSAGFHAIAECRAQADRLLFRILHASHVCGGTLTLQGPLAERFGVLQREVSFCSVHFANDVTQTVLLQRILG